MLCKVMKKQGLRMYFSLENELGEGSESTTNNVKQTDPVSESGK